MPFQRVWDDTCPRVYSSWEADGATWIIQDLLPEDDGEALQLLMQYMIPDEALCNACNLQQDVESIQGMGEYWKATLALRMSLACYLHKDGQKTLVSTNCLKVVCQGDSGDLYPIKGKLWKNVYDALSFAESQKDAFKLFGVDKILYAMGLVVRRDYRGAKLGVRMLAAREQLALSHGIEVTTTVFTGIASQKCASYAGFEVIARVTMKQLAESGLNYPRDESKDIVYMGKRFV